MQAKEITRLRLVRRAAAVPRVEPMRVGIPFAPGLLRDSTEIGVSDGDGRVLPVQAAALASWPDGSVRWALVEFLVPAESGGAAEVAIWQRTAADPRAGGSCTIRERDGTYVVDTGGAAIEIGGGDPRATLRWQSKALMLELRIGIAVEDAAGHRLEGRLDDLRVEAGGPVRATIAARGTFCGRGGAPVCRFALRLSAYAATACLRLELTLHNPRRALHRGGRWDLGDPGSILIRSATAIVSTEPAGGDLRWRLLPTEPEQASDAERLEIYQASSGGEQWASRTHCDRDGRVRLPFRGCEARLGARVLHVDRAAPTLSRIVSGCRVCIARPRFWQEFPSTLWATPEVLGIGFFPQHGSAHELQGGEQKTFTAFVSVAPENEPDLAWVHDPLTACLSPAYVAATGAVPYLVPADRDPHADYLRLIAAAIDGAHSFFAKREVVDEYGWRNFGDTWADHEQTHFTGPAPVISHYNNQYDLIDGFLLQFLRSGDPRWLELGADLARHVIDIDLYRTDEDKPAYNGGQFWHTAHYEDAGRATHRSYSGDRPRGRRAGGGPSCEQLYTTGLLRYHYLTGDPAAGEAVVQLADWVLRMDDGAHSLLGYLDSGPTGLASSTRTFAYHGPGRGAGNAVNALLDAHLLTGAPHYLEHAEALITRCVHPGDDPGQLGCDDPESRWSYTVFLQVLGKYLDRKRELGQRDRIWAYARASLCRYADWMLVHEAPFAARFDRVEYPTESWPAQDIRKSCVFDYAALYGPDASRAAMTAAAARFFAAAVAGVASFPTRACTRPLAVLLANGGQRAAFRIDPPPAVPQDVTAFDFGLPSGFRPQKERVLARLATVGGWVALVRAALQPAVWQRLLTGRIW